MPDGSAGPVLPVADARKWWVLAVVVAAQFMFVVDAFILNVALPSVAADLKAGPGEMEAVIAVYQAGYAALALAVFGFGQGLVMASLAGQVLARATPTQAGAASGLLNTV